MNSRLPDPRPPVAWKTAPGWLRLQVHTPVLAKALSRIRGAELIGRSVAGPYLRLFALPRSLAWAYRWIARHTVTNERFSPPPARLRPSSDTSTVTERGAS